MRLNRLLWLSFPVFLAGLVLARARTTADPVSVRFHSWVVYWDEAGGRQALARHGSLFDEMALFAWHFDGSGRLIPARPLVKGMREELLRSWRAPGRRLLATVVNDVESPQGVRLKDPQVVHTLVADPERRAAHISQLMELVEGLDGLEIDYERLNPADRDAFTVFIRDLSKALRPIKKSLSVVVQPRTARTSPVDPNGAGAIDWAALLPFVDRLKVMAYLYHHAGSGPGSIASTQDIAALIRYARAQVPAHQLSLILHTGGFDWPEEGPGRSIEFRQVQALVREFGGVVITDPETASGHYRYVRNGVEHQVWIETAEGLRRKVDQLRQAGVRHVGFWRLGTGDPRLWGSL